MLSADELWIPKIRGAYVAYLRTSDRPYSRLSVIAQRKAVAMLLSNGRSRVLSEFVEQEPLTAGARPALEEAIALCKARNATLVFGRLDRIRGGVRWLELLFEERVRFLGADLPHVNNANFYRIKMADTEHRRSISNAVKLALSKSKSAGTALGGKRENSTGLKLGPAASVASRQRKALSRDRLIMEQIELLRHRGVSTLTGMAQRLNQMGHRAPRGGEWSPAQIRSVIKTFED